MILSLRSALLSLIMTLAMASAQATVGLIELAAKEGPQARGPVTIFYPSDAPEQALTRGRYAVNLALNGAVQPGNARVVVISHGSPASPWVHTDLARVLVESGFTVVMPEHYADNDRDDSEPGPPSWRRRPVEVSKALDAIAEDPRFQHLLPLRNVGMSGMSAGGHTALVLAGGRWSPSQLLAHCEKNMKADFVACAGPSFRLNGGLFDGLKMGIIRGVISRKLSDATWYSHKDPRITAIIAGVPFAADFDPASFGSIRPALALMTARKDRWLNPEFHSDAILAGCPSCEHLIDLPSAGHGAYLSPLPPAAFMSDLVADPVDFDREKSIPEINRRMRDFFVRQLLK